MGVVTIRLQVEPMTEAEAATLKSNVQTNVAGKTIKVLEVTYTATV